MLVYRGPDGAEVEEPSEEYLRGMLLGADLTYWNGPAGDAGLFRQDGSDDADLILIVQQNGVLVRHRDNVTGDERFLSQAPRGDDGWVEVYDGQETWRIGHRFLVPREMAWKAVTEFSRTGQPATGLRWEENLEIQEE